MTKLDIFNLAKNTKNQATVAQAIDAHFPGYSKENASLTCYAFATCALDKDTRKKFAKYLEKK